MTIAVLALAATAPPAHAAGSIAAVPFSYTDVGWVFLAAVVLLLVGVVVRGLGRRRARGARRALAEDRVLP